MVDELETFHLDDACGWIKYGSYVLLIFIMSYDLPGRFGLMEVQKIKIYDWKYHVVSCQGFLLMKYFVFFKCFYPVPHIRNERGYCDEL